MEGLSREEKFRAAVNVIRSLPKRGSFQPSNELMLKFYSYYKQATEGPCTSAKPSFWDIVNKAKWEAWKSLGNMPKEEAMEHYVDELKKIVETMSYTESVADFMDILGPFYEFVPLEENEVKHNGNGGQESDEDNHILVKQTMDNTFDTLDNMSVAKSLKKQLKSKKCNGDVRDCAINNRQFSEAFNAMNNSNSRKENGADESETDEFSDTYDQITEEENGNGLLEETDIQVDYNSNNFKDHMLLKNGKNDHIMQARGGGDQRPSSSTGNRESSSNGRPFRSRQSRDTGLLPHIPSPMYPSTNVNPGGNGNEDDGAVGGRHSVDVGEQLALAVIKLQHTMDEVVNRLDSLEILLQDKQHDKSNQELPDRRFLWSLFGLSPGAAIVYSSMAICCSLDN